MASIANEQFELYLPDKELHSNVLKENSVPHYIVEVKKLDDFNISVLKDRRGSGSNELINQDRVLEQMQEILWDPFANSGSLLRKASTPMNSW